MSNTRWSFSNEGEEVAFNWRSIFTLAPAIGEIVPSIRLRSTLTSENWQPALALTAVTYATDSRSLTSLSVVVTAMAKLCSAHKHRTDRQILSIHIPEVCFMPPAFPS